MTEDQIWKVRNVFYDGFSFLRKVFDSLDRKAQFWMGFSLAGFIGIASLIIQQENSLSSYFIQIGSSVCVCFLLAIYYLSKTLKPKAMGTGIQTLRTDKDFDAILSFLGGNFIKFEKAQLEGIFEDYTSLKKVCDEKVKYLLYAQTLLFFGIPVCFGLSLFIRFLIKDDIFSNFYITSLFSFIPTNLFSFIPTNVFSGILIGIFVCVFIFIFCHCKFPCLLEFFNRSYKKIVSIFKLFKLQKTVTKSTPKK